MIVVPVLAGVWMSGPSWRHLPLLGLWWVGYFAFFATGWWLRAGRRSRHLPPVRAYGLALVPFALALLMTSPHLVLWALPYAPLVVISLWCSIRRMDRSLLNDVVTLVAAGLTTAVAYDVIARGPGVSGAGFGSNLPDPGWPWVWVVTALITAYFVGTIFYVKTNIRERDNPRYLVASVVYHLLGLVAVLALVGGSRLHWSHALVWVLLLARAWAVPLIGRRRRVTPKQLGIGEICASIAVLVTVLL